MVAESQRLAARGLAAHQRRARVPVKLQRPHRVRTGPTGRQLDTDGDAKGFTGSVGPRKDVTDCCRVRTTSLETRRTQAPVRSPDRDGDIDDDDWVTGR